MVTVVPKLIHMGTSAATMNIFLVNLYFILLLKYH